MVSVVGEIFIDRPPEAVFAVLADERNEPLYNRRMSACELVSPEPIGSGSTFRATINRGRRPLDMVVEFTEFDPPRSLGSHTTVQGMALDGRVTLEREGSGTRMRWRWEVNPGGALRLADPVVAWMGRRQEEDVWANLKRLLEGCAGAERALPAAPAAKALASCAARTAALLARGRLHQPAGRVGTQLRFADGAISTVYRETVVDRPPPARPAVLEVAFRLRRVDGELSHALFRKESLLNTVLFAGFPGFVSKLWLNHDESGIYRGVYEWDSAPLAVDYVRALWWPLAVLSEPGSIRYRVLPGLSRGDFLADPPAAEAAAGEWRHVAPAGGSSPGE